MKKRYTELLFIICALSLGACSAKEEPIPQGRTEQHKTQIAEIYSSSLTSEKLLMNSQGSGTNHINSQNNRACSYTYRKHPNYTSYSIENDLGDSLIIYEVDAGYYLETNMVEGLTWFKIETANSELDITDITMKIKHNSSLGLPLLLEDMPYDLVVSDEYDCICTFDHPEYGPVQYIVNINGQMKSKTWQDENVNKQYEFFLIYDGNGEKEIPNDIKDHMFSDSVYGLFESLENHLTN